MSFSVKVTPCLRGMLDSFFSSHLCGKKNICDIMTSGCSSCVCLQGMRVLVDARDKLGISWQSCENEKQGMLVMSWEGRVGASGVEPSEFQLYVMALSALWADAGIQEAYTRRSEFQLVSRHYSQSF